MQAINLQGAAAIFSKQVALYTAKGEIQDDEVFKRKYGALFRGSLLSYKPTMLNFYYLMLKTLK